MLDALRQSPQLSWSWVGHPLLQAMLLLRIVHNYRYNYITLAYGRSEDLLIAIDLYSSLRMIHSPVLGILTYKPLE
jgi:hypothetical protein